MSKQTIGRRTCDSRRGMIWKLLFAFGLLLAASVPLLAQTEAGEYVACPAQDAEGEGPCDLFLGYRWNGEVCEGISGCTCVGADCGDLFSTLEECQSKNCRCLCEPQDAEGAGLCEIILGWAWNGRGCEAIVGCECLGEDCDQLFSSPGECLAAHETCPCAPQDAQGVGACEAILGYAWDGSQCNAVVGCSCTGADCDEIGTLAECLAEHRKCICRAQDAFGEGPCDLFLGYRWNGESCESVSGCSCVGADCAALSPTLAACQALHEPCPCRAQDAAGEGPCDLFLGYRWNGESCESISGCSCVGSDCGNLFSTLAKCEQTNGGCVCRAQDAVVSGPCDQFFGYRWNGVECVAESGCQCIGGDCDELSPTLAECQSEHAKCVCRAQDATGVGPCDQFFGYRWDGAMCVAVNGCSCVGPDCGNLIQDLNVCESVHADCDPCCGCQKCPVPKAFLPDRF